MLDVGCMKNRLVLFRNTSGVDIIIKATWILVSRFSTKAYARQLITMVTQKHQHNRESFKQY